MSTLAAAAAGAAAMLLGLALSSTVWPQAPAAPGAVQTPLELRFDIARYRVEGNTLLPAEEVDRIVSAYAGKGRDFGDVQRALEALQEAYRERGYSAVQVYLPEQELARGEVLLRVIEARVSKLEVRGNKFFDEANIRASLPALTEGTTPNANVVAKNLALANENPAKQTNVTLRAGAKEGDVEARVDVTDENPTKWFVTLDNTGTPATGYDRVGLGYQDANLFGLDHAMTLQAVTSVEKPSKVGIYSIGYHLPLYAQGASMDFVAGYSDVDAGTTQTPSAGPLAFSGRGGVLGARYNWHLNHYPGYDHRLIFGLDHRMYRNTCTLGVVTASCGGAASATFSLTPVSLTYAGVWTQPNSRLGLNAGITNNLGGGSRGDSEALSRGRAGASDHYWLVRAGLDWAQALPEDWQLRARLLVQHTDEVLVAPEQFGIGGANSVRGFLERERADDRGHSGTVEIYTPELAPHLGMKDWNARALAFYDFGRVARVNPLPGEQVRDGIASAGVGIRLALQKSFSLRFDLAQIVDPGGTRERNSVRFAFGTVWAF
ncbi:MAG: ShlB/FhaC/HecB family hemolysin secretion/activation protein [Betaproteobacteria bacterium]|nr:ShlB/FhaC/HecB family hemolysin secretion/activation protein [Betaproteobacteria bacterium]